MRSAFNRVLDLVRQIALVRVPRQQQRELGGRHALRVAERTGQLVGRFAMRPDGRRVFGREGREIEHGLSSRAASA